MSRVILQNKISDELTSFINGTIAGITLPNDITSIGDYAFAFCESLTNISIPDSVTDIGKGAFYYCSRLKNVNIPNGITAIKDSTFKCSRLENINIPDTVTVFEREAFYYCNISSVNIPNGTRFVGILAFGSCRYLNNVVLPSSFTGIGNCAFEYCSSLNNLTIKAISPPNLGIEALEGTASDLVIYVPSESVEVYKSASGWSTYSSRIQAIPA